VSRSRHRREPTFDPTHCAGKVQTRRRHVEPNTLEPEPDALSRPRLRSIAMPQVAVVLPAFLFTS
jgi:hypothetical protein